MMRLGRMVNNLSLKVYRTLLSSPSCQHESTAFFDAMEESIRKSCGILTNSFCKLESKYYEYTKNVMRQSCSLVGPVNLHAKSERRGVNNVLQNEAEINVLKWLDSRQPNSVVYISFGSEMGIHGVQFQEIAHGLEVAGHPFILVARMMKRVFFPEGFEQRIRESNQGLVIKDWAPQLLILGHSSVGAFMTHCGWNSCLEALSDGVPMIGWPLTVDQFFNESLIVDVLKVGFRIGSQEDIHRDNIPKVVVTRDQVKMPVKRMMSDTKQVEEMRTRAKLCASNTHLAVQKCGSSFQDVCALVKELKGLRTGNSD